MDDSSLSLSLPWKGWTRTATPDGIEIACDTAPIVVTLTRIPDGVWCASLQIDGATPLVVTSTIQRLDRMEGRVVWALREAIGLERDRLARKQAAIAAMAMEVDLG